MKTFSARVEQKAPRAIPTPESLDLPETLSYRIKKRLLGPPLITEQLRSERLGKPTALAVLSSDVMSSCAYATEQILFVLVPVVGVAAYSLAVPITLALLVVLTVVTLSYREVVQAYPKAGGAYVVSRDNFGPRIAQVAGVALLIDYTLTVAVSVAAGTAALVSAIPAIDKTYVVVGLSVLFVLIIAYGNLRGIREAGKAFAVPTYLFIANMALLIVVGVVREALGQLHPESIHRAGTVAIGHAGGGILVGASMFLVLKAFSSGGSALTGTEAISNGVSVFRHPEAKNARATLVMMALILGTMFLGVSALASWTHAVPYVSQTPTVLAQVAKFAYGANPLGRVLFYVLQISTLLILVLAANTSFTGFPFLASFAAEDSFLPRQLTRRGHRLVFSNGIIVLTVVSVVLLIATEAKVSSLIALYAIGVFTGFTMAGAGMVKHHLTHRQGRWRVRLAVNLSAAVLSFIVDIVIMVTKFTEGAWVVVVLLPLLSLLFVRLHHRYGEEAEELEENAPVAWRQPILRRHVVLVLVDRMDLATARAIQYARTLTPDELRVVHFVLDTKVAQELEQGWELLNNPRLTLELIDCPDRRLGRGVLELVAETLADGETEVSVLLPRRFYGPVGYILHDRTADRIATIIGQLEHANATVVPFKLGKRYLDGRRRSSGKESPPGDGAVAAARLLSGQAGRTTPIGEVKYRQRARVAGQVKSIKVQPSAVSPSLCCRLADSTGGLTLVFQGRRKVAGIDLGVRLVAEGMVGEQGERLAIFNPVYEIIATADPDEESPGN
jgi:amino acid transporter